MYISPLCCLSALFLSLPPSLSLSFSLFLCTELDYVFGMYVGILFTSTIWFFLYSVLMKFKPQINIKLTVPGLISGIMFGIGTGTHCLS